jgi:hypothetical protein
MGIPFYLPAQGNCSATLPHWIATPLYGGVYVYAAPSLRVIDEVGYLSYSNRHADLLFELINCRHEQKSTLVTTNKSFAEWSEVFPNAACVVALIDRLVHHAEIIAIKGKSYRQKEAQERAEQRSKKRKATTSRSTA